MNDYSLAKGNRRIKAHPVGSRCSPGDKADDTRISVSNGDGYSTCSIVLNDEELAQFISGLEKLQSAKKEKS